LASGVWAGELATVRSETSVERSVCAIAARPGTNSAATANAAAVTIIAFGRVPVLHVSFKPPLSYGP
jgi:hypothetical protein